MRWLEAIWSPEKLDSLLAYLTYNIAVWTSVVTLVALIMTVVSIRGPLKESTKARELETKEKRIERSLELIRMMANVDPET